MNLPGIPRGTIKNCKGIILLSVVEAGFIFSGNVGTGVVIAHKYDGTWSPPSAIGLGGIGWGFMVGAEVKDIVICVMEDTVLDTLSGEHKVKIGGQVRSESLSYRSMILPHCIILHHFDGFILSCRFLPQWAQLVERRRRRTALLIRVLLIRMFTLLAKRGSLVAYL